MQKCLFLSDWFYKINLLVLQLVPCDLLQLAPQKEFHKQSFIFKLNAIIVFFVTDYAVKLEEQPFDPCSLN